MPAAPTAPVRNPAAEADPATGALGERADGERGEGGPEREQGCRQPGHALAAEHVLGEQGADRDPGGQAGAAEDLRDHDDGERAPVEGEARFGRDDRRAGAHVALPGAATRSLIQRSRRRGRDIRPVVGLVHAHRDHQPGDGGERGDGPHGGADAERVGDDAGEQRADGEAAVAPEPVDADRRGRARPGGRRRRWRRAGSGRPSRCRRRAAPRRAPRRRRCRRAAITARATAWSQHARRRSATCGPTGRTGRR